MTTKEPKNKVNPDWIGGKQEAKEQRPSLVELDEDPANWERVRRRVEHDFNSLFDDPEKL